MTEVGNQNPVRLGIMSTAAVTRHLLGVIAALNELDEKRFVTVSAVSSRDAAKAAEFAATYKIPHAYGSHDELLHDVDVDAVYITMPNHAHVEWITRSLAAGKHVLCEKPLVLSTTEALQVQAAQTRSQAFHGRPLIVMEAVMSLYTPQTRQLETLIASGALGHIQHLRGSFQYFMTRQSFRSSPAKEGGGSLWDVGCYPVYLARHLLKMEPIACSGTAVWSTEDSNSNYDATFSGSLTFPGGTSMHLCSSLVTPFGTTAFEVHGTKGSVLLNNAFKPSSATDGIQLSIIDHDGGALSTTFLSSSNSSSCALDAVNPYYGELKQFCGMVTSTMAGAAVECPTGPQFSLGQVCVMEGLFEAARSGTTVALKATTDAAVASRL
jgi:D-xylose 1-dehydrogenase (NADP+, D-xylono-1,5-lactone-forming)